MTALVSLFSGAGGLDLGFVQAGYEISFALDHKSAAIATHELNFTPARSLVGDIEALGAQGLTELVLETVEPGTRIGVIGGPPCQGFSRANTGRQLSDPRNNLALIYIDVISALQKEYELEFAIFENVPEIRSTRHSSVFNEIVSRLEALGLRCHVDNYQASQFGVPQQRERTIVAAVATDEPFEVLPLMGPPQTVRDAIGSLPEPAYFVRGLSSDEIPHHPNHWTMQPRSAKFRDGSSSTKSRSFKRLQWDKPSPTVAYGHREIHVHPEGHRRLSIYEAMRLQGFPTSFVLAGTLSQQVEQVSNAVPPPLSYAIASAVKQTTSGQLVLTQ
jgi:DNA (cytosine-5)-methyltransferase 1